MQTAAPCRVADAVSIVGDRNDDLVCRCLDLDGCGPGLCMPHDVRESFPHEGRDVVSERVLRADDVDRTGEGDGGRFSEGGADLVDDVDQAVAKTGVVFAGVRKREDDRPDTGDRVVQDLHCAIEPRLNETRPHGRFDALQLHPGAEQLLDDVVVQVPGDARTVLEEQHPLTVGARRCHFDRERRLAGQRRGVLQVERGESRSPRPPAGEQHRCLAVGCLERHEQRGTEARDLERERRREVFGAGRLGSFEHRAELTADQGKDRRQVGRRLSRCRDHPHVAILAVRLENAREVG